MTFQLRVLISDNGHQFTFTEFEEFLQQNDIIKIVYKSPPYNPASNGLVENIVKNVKLKEGLTGIKLAVLLHSLEHTVIFHTVTNKNPTDLF